MFVRTLAIVDVLGAARRSRPASAQRASPVILLVGDTSQPVTDCRPAPAGQPSCSSGWTRSIYAIASSMQASAATLPPAVALDSARCSRSTIRRSSIIELGGNDGLRGGSLEAMRDNLDAMTSAAQNAGSRVLLIGMPRSAELRRGLRRALRRDLRRGCPRAQGRAGAVPVRGIRRKRLDVPARSHPSAGRPRRQRCWTMSGRRSRRCFPLRKPRERCTLPGQPRRRRRTARAPRPHRRPQPGRIRRRPYSRRAQSSGARRRRACPDRHHARSLAVRGAQARCGAGRAQHRENAGDGIRRAAARMEAAGLLLARRTAQPRRRACAERGRMARRATRRRLPRVPPPCRRAARSAAGTVSLPGDMRLDRFRQEPASRRAGRRRRANARSGGHCTASRLAAGPGPGHATALAEEIRN